MSETYSRVGSISIKAETTPNTAVTPTIFIPFNDEDLPEEHPYTAVMPIESNRMVNRRATCAPIPAPDGTINLSVEPKTFGNILKGVFGSVTTGVKFASSDADNGDIAVGDTITNASTGTGTVVAIIAEENIILASGVSGDWATGDTIGNGGTHTSTLGTFDDSVYGHLATLPAEVSTTYTVQKNYSDRAMRFFGCRFYGLDALAQGDNVITAGVKVMAQSMFRHARVTEALTDGAGAKTIKVDQVVGLVDSDTIKVYRPSTGAFLDFSASSVKTHTIGTVDFANSELDITNLETALAVGDLIVLAPQTASYTTADEFCWVGGSQLALGADKDSFADIDVEDYTMVITNEFESRHRATGATVWGRFPAAILQKGLTGAGTFTVANENEDYFRHSRINNGQAVRLTTTGDQIGSTGIYHQMIVTYGAVQFDPYSLNLSADDIVNEEVPFTAFYDETNAFGMQVLLINDVSSY